MHCGPLLSRSVTRTSAVFAASACVLTLLLAGCGDDKASTSTGSSTTGTSAAAQPSGQAEIIDTVKAATFLVTYKTAFPALAEGKDDNTISAIYADTCKEIKAGKAQDVIITNVTERTKSPSVTATATEAQMLYETIKTTC